MQHSVVWYESFDIIFDIALYIYIYIECIDTISTIIKKSCWIVRMYTIIKENLMLFD